MTNLNAIDPAAVAQDAHLESADVVIAQIHHHFPPLHAEQDSRGRAWPSSWH